LFFSRIFSSSLISKYFFMFFFSLMDDFFLSNGWNVWRTQKRYKLFFFSWIFSSSPRSKYFFSRWMKCFKNAIKVHNTVVCLWDKGTVSRRQQRYNFLWIVFTSTTCTYCCMSSFFVNAIFSLKWINCFNKTTKVQFFLLLSNVFCFYHK